MFTAILGCWPLFLGLGLLSLGVGLQGTLLGVRASLEGFNTTLTGVIMSGYYVGFFIGSLRVPTIIKRVGHVRTFGALASLVSIAVLVHAVFVNPWVWTFLRFVSGFSMIGIWLVAESWLNTESTNDTRGSLLAFYMFIVFSGIGGGQFLMNLGDPDNYELFILISVLVSLAVLPVLITKTNAPSFETPEKVKLKDLYQRVPLGVVGSFVITGTHAMIFAMGAVYATKIGLSVRDISLFMGTIIFSGVLVQWPLGKVSDHFDRRLIISVSSLLAAFFAVIAAFIGASDGWPLFLCAALIGGFSLPLYSLNAAHVNDYLAPDQIVSANATMFLVGGIGAIAGPVFSAVCIDQFGPSGFFWGLALACAGLSLFAAWRLTRRPPPPIEERSEFTIHAPATIAIVFENEIFGGAQAEGDVALNSRAK